MAAASKSSQTVKNVIMALLTLWSIVSLVVIVVWATSPDLKGSAQCRAELQEVTEKHEGAKVVCKKDKVALEERVIKEQEKNDIQTADILLLLGRLNATNATLEECRLEKLVLSGNISSLQEEVEQLRLIETNLTAQLRLQEDLVELLQQNLTQAFHQTEACFSLKAAADSQALAEKSKTRGCESSREYLTKQLQKCQTECQQMMDPPPAQTSPPQQTQQKKGPGSAASPLVPALTLLVCSGLHLIT